MYYYTRLINSIEKKIEISKESLLKLPEIEKIINKGTGAGGSNTNKLGKKFEEVSNYEPFLLKKGFTPCKINNSKFGYCLKKEIDNLEVVYVSQSGLKTYFKKKNDIDLFRNPDEAYIITDLSDSSKKIKVKILEKKEQNNQGSVEIKLWSGPSLKREYEIILGDKFKVDYGFCLNNYFFNEFNSESRKYNILKQILQEQSIDILFGENSDYFKKLESWIYK